MSFSEKVKQPKIVRVSTVPQSLRVLLSGQLKYISENGFEIIGVSSSGHSLEEVERIEGVRTYGIEMTRRITPLKDLKALWKLYLFFKKENPFIVHSITPKAGLLAMLAGKMAGIPHRLHDVAGLPLMEAKGLRRMILILVEKLTYLLASKVYPVSYGIQYYIIKNNFLNRKKAKMILNGSSNGIDTEYFNPETITDGVKERTRRELGIEAKDLVILFVGRMVRDKGVGELVSALTQLSSRNKNVKLILVGDFEHELDPLEPITIREIENNPNIIFQGYQEDVKRYYAIANIFVLPSYREGFGNVTAEAAAMSVPSIVSDITGSNEIIIDGKNGLIIPVKDSVALRIEMERLLADKDLRTRLQMAARHTVVSRYQRTLFWAAILDEYNALLTEKGLK